MTNARTTIWVMAVVLSLASPPLMAWTQFKDGQIHNIDYEINDDVWVDWEAPGMETTINLIYGGNVPFPYELQGYNDSRINISGGTIAYFLRAFDNSHVYISSGSIYYLYARDNSEVDFSGGSINGLYVWDNSHVDFSGGTVVWGLYVPHSGVLSIEGSDFAVDGEDVGYGELTSIRGDNYLNEPIRHLTGTLTNGDPLDNDFYIGHDGKIVLVPVLTSIEIGGPSDVNENSGAQYTCTAHYDNGSTSDVTSSTIWSENSNYASIDSSGYLTTSLVTSDQPCQITATYEGKSDTHDVTIKNIPDPLVGDFCGPNGSPPDGYVDVWDLMQFADHWHSRNDDGNWDSKFDLTGPDFGAPDGYVDVWDLMVFADNWHKGQKP